MAAIATVAGAALLQATANIALASAVIGFAGSAIVSSINGDSSGNASEEGSGKALLSPKGPIEGGGPIRRRNDRRRRARR